ncbi:hypothetical protein ACL02R_22865 [Streptomyces sp. MS19]|uniref:hypothetical protein n=1 Tax=Streptomyces sp. MS19 TaxID=3385972 RepID=UPI0039A0153F
MPPAHFHAYHWQGEHRVFGQEADRRPAAAPGTPPSPGFLADPCTPLRISDWLLRPSGAVARTLGAPDAAADWFGREAARALAWGGDVHAGWYLRGTGYLTPDVIGRSPHHTDPRLPCPLRG